MQNLLRQSIQSNSAAAINYVAPVGRSVDTATFQGGQNKPLAIGSEEAEKIREFEKLEWMTAGNLTLKTDGFKFHTSGLSIENPERDGFLMAEVTDPVFSEESNPYTVASQKRAQIEVLARKGYRDDRLVRIQIIEFIRELDDHT